MKAVMVRLSFRVLAKAKRRARELGVTFEQYLLQLIEDDLAVSAKGRSTSFAKLGAPFRKALGHLSEEEFDLRVKAARAARRKERSRTMREKVSHSKMVAMAKKNPPPQSWYEEDFRKVRKGRAIVV
jgi:hypothetical protein